MLSINFYSNDGQTLHTIRMVDSFYEWLAKSDFAKLGRSYPTQIDIEGEPAELPLVQLGVETRQKLIDFFSDTIFQETKVMLDNLENPSAQQTLTTQTYRLRKLLEMLDCLKSEVYQYLQRG